MAGKTNRKHRRNKDWCERYEKRGTRELNKELKMKRHSAVHPNDLQRKATPANYTRKKPFSNFELYINNLRKR